MVSVQIWGEGIDEFEGRARTLCHGNRHGAVERHDGRGLKAGEKIVEPEDLRPIRIFGTCGAAMESGYSSLHSKGAWRCLKRLLDQGQGFGNLGLMPAAAILLLENHEIAGRIETGVAPRILKEHEGYETSNFRGRPGRQQGPQQAAQADGLGAEISSHQGPDSGAGIAFVEDQIDHREHRVEPLRHSVGTGHGIGNARVANLALGTHQALRHGGRWHQKRARNLVGVEAAQSTEGQGDLRIQGKRRMTASEDEAKAIVGDFVGVVVRLMGRLAQTGKGVRLKFFLEARSTADNVDSLMAGGLDDPGAGEFRNAGGAPLIHSGRKCLLRGLFGHFEVAHQANEGGDDAAPVGVIERLDGTVGIQVHAQMVKNCLVGCRFRHPPFELLNGGTHMQYMLLIYGDEQALSEAERAQCYKESTEYAHRLNAKGQYLACAPLHPTSTATSVRVRDSKRLVTDGPFAETREQLGGFFLIDAKDLDEAIGIAGQIPAGRWGTVEIRPVIEVSGLPKDSFVRAVDLAVPGST